MTAQTQPQHPPPRAPSPTPSEKEDLERGVINWNKVLRWQTWLKMKYIPWYIGLAIISALTVLMTLYHKELVHWLRPAADWMHEFSVGWLVPIVVLFIISFPPLFGHEIVAVLCGLVWGLWIGFAIVCAGTLLGEIGNFYAFRYCLRGRAIKMERKNPSYACLARVVRDGGFLVAFVVRLSAIPGHFTTAVFSTCGMGIWIFTLAAFLSLPKQFITVYLGVILEQSADGTRSTQDTIISNAVLIVTFLITVVAAWWIWREMGRVRLEVLRERRAERKAKLAEAGVVEMELKKLDRASDESSARMSHAELHAAPSMAELVGNDPFNPRSSDDALVAPLGSSRTAQKWDQGGRAVPAEDTGVYTQYDPYAPPMKNPLQLRFPSQPQSQFQDRQESTGGSYYTAREGH
ncbi:Golgi apparatus membrane protein TVP38 [Rhizoctonia solani AG-1 IB]|uniref:Golgi apparatus membrane protein TVP38 n=1 Tax=Thanatephorus cucumeris (strain AG1-IB / isolate 7/3/14) TaxID=1108050 RepID=M5C2E9_THACB|nr:Golgi apparatus membrane protein TVP38 [Rhizoctonia solani AG-1 IB]